MASSPFIGRWAGNVYGTNTGRVLIDIAADGDGLRGVVRLNDPVSGLAIFSCSGDAADVLDLELSPLSAAEGVEITAGRVRGHLRPDGSISGEWETIAGTAGTFQVFPHAALMGATEAAPVSPSHGNRSPSEPEKGAAVEEDLSVKIHLKRPAINCSLDRAELKHLAEILQERSNAARDLELATFHPEGLAPEVLERQRNLLRESFTLKFTVMGSDGRELFGTIREVFESPNYPEEVSALFVASDNTLRAVHNYYPRNAFRLFLYFSKPAVLDFRILPGLDTPNASNFEVEGYDATWANGVFREIDAFLKNKPSKLAIVHRHSIYDLLLYPIGIPIAFWVCHKASSVVQGLVPESGFLQNSIYVYLFAAAVISFRIVFHYVRWVFPVVEYRAPASHPLVHRTALVALVLSILGAFVYDVLKYVLGGSAGAG